MKLAKKIIRWGSSKSNSGKWVSRCAAPEVERQISKVVEAVVDSPSELNDIEFPEYDPTPYDGGYDIALAYGEPLRPSDEICHPRSSSDPDSRNLEEFSYGSVIAPYGQEPVKADLEKPRDSSGLMQPDVEEKAQNGQELVQIDDKKPQSGNGWANSHVEEKPSSDGNDIFSYGNGYGNGYGGGDYEKAMVPYHGEEERNGYEYGMEEPQPEHGYGYEDLFGGWLPLARGEGDSCNPHDADKPSNGNQWNGTADYIFGFSYPYGEGNNDSHSYGNSIYGHEKHSHVQPNHMLLEYQEPLWTPKPTFYQDYEEEIHIQTEYVSLYERHSNAQPQYGHSEYSETSWFQEPGYYEDYQEEGYPGPQYGNDSYRERGEELYYHENYSIYDE
ncbi:hypothetical protein CKAN_00411700 [Cinnamomum micranthum f. kanehirae]|uniref:Uncharacterized protein n=1 Tax=Cinnamomum micranthum f. kanehirae TaxID=337451 RepID=A0A3S3M9P9_9MAGN|nr:hypothetical protein CKAN_00411700 [Cinnamomum micranthum f. kanehirae]